MLYFTLAILVLCATSEALPEPQTTVHIQNYDGPIIVHSSACDSLCRKPNVQCQQCETDCSCVTRQCYYPCTTQTAYPACTTQTAYPATSYGCCNQYCNDDCKVYTTLDNNCGGYRCANNYVYKCPTCY